jgi:hypothetical protein
VVNAVADHLDDEIVDGQRTVFGVVDLSRSLGGGVAG